MCCTVRGMIIKFSGEVHEAKLRHECSNEPNRENSIIVVDVSPNLHSIAHHEFDNVTCALAVGQNGHSLSAKLHVSKLGSLYICI